MISGGAVLAAGLLVLLFAGVFALDLVLELWQAALLVGGVVTLIGLSMVTAGKHKMSAENLKPKRTLEEINRTTSFAKGQER
jgi:xanthine/uracil permease